MNPASSNSCDGSAQHLDVAVIGGGQAGLAIGYFLRQHGYRFVILERASEFAPAWRERWDSLTLFTPRRYSALPGLPFPGDPDGYPTRDEVIAYLEQYAETFELPVELNSEVKKLERGDDGRFRLERRWTDDHRRAGRRRDRARSRRRTCRSSPRSSPAMSSRRTPSATAGRMTCRRERCSWSAAATPAFRSRRSSRRRTRSCSRSARARSRCPSACSGATSSGG